MQIKIFFKRIALATALTNLTLVALMSFMNVAVAQIAPGEKPPVPEPRLEATLNGIRQNSRKVQNFRVRTITLVKTPPNFWAEGAPPATPRTLVAGYDVRIRKDLGFFLDGRTHLDQLQVRILPSPLTSLFDHRQYWQDKEAGISYTLTENAQILQDGQVRLLNAGFPTAYEKENLRIPFTVFALMQIASRPERDLGADYLGTQLVGEQQFQGLPCLRLEWDFPAGRQFAYRVKGFALVCPSRDYKVLYRQEESTSEEKTTPTRSEKDVLVVEQLTQYGDAWMPSRVSHQWSKVAADGETSTLSEVFRVLEFEPNAVRDDSIFSPIFSPGTRVFRAGADKAGNKLEIAGGDTTALEGSLSTGDFSLFTPLTAPTTDSATALPPK